MTIWKWLLAAALVAHAYALYRPGGPDPGFASLFPENTDKLVHVVLFATPALLIRALTARWWPLWLLALHAPISEVIQWRFIPYRSGDPWDRLADLIGIALGIGAAEWWRRRRSFAHAPASSG